MILVYPMMNKKAPSNFLEALNFDAYNKSYGDILPRIVIRAMNLDINRRFRTVEEMKQQIHKAKDLDGTRLLHQPEKVINHSVETKNYSSNVKKKE
ncbi:hypothetical protein [Clostridium thermarum]|uniref:hypothetical protein n=1 Tax=Clostridium thermarum TaxID=1716543 RepID=UPI0013D40D02|nr:hypothetical protein [Clostridium thermarum]